MQYKDTMLYITFPKLLYFINGSLYPLTLFTHFTHPPQLAAGNHKSVLCSHELIFFNSQYNWDYIFVFLWLILISIMSSGPIHVVTSGKISSFYGSSILVWNLYIFWKLTLTRYMTFKYFLLFSMLTSHFANHFLYCFFFV